MNIYFNKKKICILQKVDALDPRSFFKQGRSLVKAGYDTTIISYYGKNELVENVKFVRIDIPKNRIGRFIISNYNFLTKAIKERADLYHFHDVDFIPLAILLKLITRKKVVYDVHEAHPEYMLLKTYIPDFLKKPVSKFVYYAERVSDYLFDAIITNDNYVLKDFQNGNKEVIYNYPILDFFSYASNSVPYDKRDYDIVFIGSLPKWHFLPILQTSEILENKGCSVKWLLLPTKDAPREWIRAQLRQKNLLNNFTIMDTVPFKTVPAHLYNSRIGIITIPPYEKYMKNIPLKIFEYMGCGLPVIASDLPPSRQFVEGKDCAILLKHDPEEYADAIISLLNNPDKAQEMGKRGKQLVFEQYNWNTEEKKLLKLYGKLFENEE